MTTLIWNLKKKSLIHKHFCDFDQILINGNIEMFDQSLLLHENHKASCQALANKLFWAFYELRFMEMLDIMTGVKSSDLAHEIVWTSFPILIKKYVDIFNGLSNEFLELLIEKFNVWCIDFFEIMR